MSHPLSVLLVEDSATGAAMVRILLEKSHHGKYAVCHVTTLRRAISEVHQRPYDVVLLDMRLPDSRGPEGIRRLKAAKPHLPIVVLSSDEGEEIAREAIASGAQEYLSKAHMVGQLLARMIRHSITRQAQLLEAQSQALTDPLMGIANRRAFDLELSKRVADFNRHRAPCAIALLDIDLFKEVNDQLGHDRGDEVLRILSRSLASSVRETDLVARYGGEEFGLIFPGTDLDEAFRIVERCCEQVRSIEWHGFPHLMKVTLSAGLAEMSGEVTECAIVQQADAALYAAKDSGRDCCCTQECVDVDDPTRSHC